MNKNILQSFLFHQAPIIVGYSGWENDVIMKCLKERLSYPTPLKYIWVCFDNNSYNSLPEWIRNNENVIFVLPEFCSQDCFDSHEKNDFLEKNIDIRTIDATMFFRKIISEFKVTAPLIFTNPYTYYSNKINSLLPNHEDVLHLRHWAQRMYISETTNNIFDKLVYEIENAYIVKDYNKACEVINELQTLDLSSGDIEFICVSLICEFIKEEEAISSFEEVLNFHISAAVFVETNIAKIANIDSILRSLRAILNIRVRKYDAKKVVDLLERVETIANKDERLIEIELKAIGIKSNFVSADEKEKFYKQIIDRCPKDLKNKTFAFLKFRALTGLSDLDDEQEAIKHIKEAEKLLNLIPHYRFDLLKDKSLLLNRLSNCEIKIQWLKEIIDVFTEMIDGKIDKTTVIEILSNVSILPFDYLQETLDIDVVKKIYIDILKSHVVDVSYCHCILNYAVCCNFVCNISDDEDVAVYTHCKNIFNLIEYFPHKCESFLNILCKTALVFLNLSNIASDTEKEEILYQIKQNENTTHLYYDLMIYAINNKYITKFELLMDDVNEYNRQGDQLSKAFELYSQGQFEMAEKHFFELCKSKYTTISDTSKTDLSFMIRRKETVGNYDFFEIIKDVSYRDATLLMDIILYCIDNEAAYEELLELTKNELKQLPKAEWKSAIECWSNIQLVGEQESVLALSIIEELKSKVQV